MKKRIKSCLTLVLIMTMIVGVVPSIRVTVNADEEISTEINTTEKNESIHEDIYSDADLEKTEDNQDLNSEIEVVSYKGTYDGNLHDIFNIKGLSKGDIVTIDNENAEIKYTYAIDEKSIPQISEVGEYSYTVKVHRDDNCNDFIFSGISEIDENNDISVFTKENSNTQVNNDDSMLWDGTSIKQPELIGYEYKIDTAEKLAWFANEVNNNGNTFEGKSICISGNIDLNSQEWVAIGNSKSGDPKEIKGDIIIRDAVIKNYKFSTNNSKHKGLFGCVKIWNLQVDNLQMENVNINSSNGYDGTLFGKLFLERNSVCEIRNSIFDGCFTGRSDCGAIAGYVCGEGDNSTLNVINCNLKIESTTYNTMWDGSRYNAYSKGGALAQYYTEANGSKVIFNGISAEVNLAGYNEYGYDSCVVGGLVGELKGNAGIYIYQCAVSGAITSSGYSGYAGGFIGKMVSCDVYKQLDSCVTATLYSRFNAYGYAYNAGGFFDGPMEKKPDGYIKNSYFAGSSSTATAFIAKDRVGGNKLRIYNCYYDTSRLSNKVYHANHSCYEIYDTTFDCAAYTTGQMGMQSNFKGWDFDNIWVMGDKYPELRRNNFELPEDFINDSSGDYDSAIVRTVREYTSQEMYSQWEKIWNSNYSDEVKFNKILELAANYGITDPKEGLEFVVTSKQKRWAYNELISDDLYTSTNFLKFLDDGGRTLLVADGLIFNSEIKDWLDVGTYVESDYPGISKYKDMLYDYMDSTSIKNEKWDDVKLVSDLIGNVNDYTTKTYIDNKIAELEKIANSSNGTRQECWNIINEMDSKGVFINGDKENSKITYKLDSTSGFGKYAKAMGLAKDYVELVDMTIQDVEDMVLLDSKLNTYYQFDSFLNDIIEAKDKVPFQLREAARQVQKEINEGYLVEVKKIAEQFMKATKITKTIKQSVQDALHIGSIVEVVEVIDIESWFINQIVDVGNMAKQASYVEGYAYLEKLYKLRLEESAKKFNNSMTEQNAWAFYYDYNMLYSLRYKGEQAYLKMHDVKGIAKKLFAHGYAEKEEATNKILEMLEKDCKFDLGDDADVPESMKYLSKLIVSCPVDVRITSDDGKVIAELKDGELQDVSNDYGRFVVVYNYSTGDYQKIIYLNQQNVKVEIISNDDGLVNMTYSYKNHDNNVVVKYMNNQPLNKECKINIEPTSVEKNGKIVILNKTDENYIQLEDEAPSYTNVDNAVLSDESVLLYIGESKLLKILVEPENASVQDVSWYSSDPEIVSVKDGKIEALSEGNAIIYAFMHDKKEPLICNVASIQPDTIAPNVEISVENNKWKDFCNDVSFDYFYKNVKEVTITANDNETKEPVIKYYLSDKKLTEGQIKSDDIVWEDYVGKFSLPLNSKRIIYAKAIDDAGNITIVNSAGIVVYTDAAVETEKITFIKNVDSDLSAKVDLNGNTIHDIKNGKTVLSINQDYVDDGAGNIVFKEEYLKTLENKDYTLNISYAPMGVEYNDLNTESQEPAITQIMLKVRNPKLKSIKQPYPLEGIANGTEKDIKALGLPLEVEIETEDLKITTADVMWNLDDITEENYNPNSLQEQTFTVKGIIKLPEDIDADGKSLETTIKVTVSKAGMVAAPTVGIAAGNYTENKDVSLSTTTDSAEIYYTTDGTIPMLENGSPIGSTKKYIDCISVIGTQGKAVSTTIKAIAIKNGMYDSEVAEFTYIISIPHKHNFDNSEWKKDTMHHWHECNVENCDYSDGYIIDKDIHEFEYSYTWTPNNKRCTAIRICKTCGYQQEECVNATVTVVQKKTCVLPEISKYVAVFKNAFNENFKEQIKQNVKTSDAIGHTVVEDARISETCTKAGKTAGSHCSVCGTVLKEQEEIPATGHAFGEWETVKSSTCEDNGSQKRVCKTCGYTETKDVNASGHSWEKDYTVDKEATCTEAGSKSIHCKNCDAVKESKVIETLGHEFVGEWTVEKEATCTEAGIKTRKCSRCDVMETESVPAIGHTVVEDAKISETCTKAGKTAGSHCSVCGTVLKEQEEIPATGHAFGEWETVKSSTCEDNGSQKRVCKTCGYTETKDVNASGHSWEKDYTVDKEATCTEAGSKSIHCKNCDAVKESKVIETLGHEFVGEWTVEKEATCTEAGIKTRKCSRCDVIETDSIAVKNKNLMNSKSNITESDEDIKGAKTGDDNNSVLWIMIIMTVFLGIARTVALKKVGWRDN